METSSPKVKKAEQIVKDVLILIDLKIRNVENETFKAISAKKFNFEDAHIAKAASPLFLSLQDNTEEYFLSLMERYSRSLTRLRYIKDKLNQKNTNGAIELLSNDKYLHCSDVTLDNLLAGREKLMQMVMAY